VTGMDRGAVYEGDVGFELTFCNLWLLPGSSTTAWSGVGTARVLRPVQRTNVSDRATPRKSLAHG